MRSSQWPLAAAADCDQHWPFALEAMPLHSALEETLAILALSRARIHEACCRPDFGKTKLATRYVTRYIPEMSEHNHDHEVHSGENLIDAARTSLLASGEQWTSMRADIFEELARHERPASAYDIADNLSAKRGKRVAPNSVYRILDLFVNNNLALRVESSNAYLANSHPGCTHDCIFLVCDECGEAAHIDSDEVSKSVRAIATQSDFEARRPIIEIRGICASCH